MDLPLHSCVLCSCVLQGSPVVAAVRARLAGIEKEYNELDGVWFMAGSLFNKWVAGFQTHRCSDCCCSHNVACG
jgi:hypothetical protein